MTKKLKLENDAKHFKETHYRWIEKFSFNRTPKNEDWQEEWISEQCFSCQFYISMIGEFRSDWGVCSNVQSPLDGRIMFEHDGCEHHSFAKDESSL